MSVFDPRSVQALATLALLTTCARAPDRPDTPDVSHELSAYAAPAGTVDTSRPVPWLAAAAARIDMLGGGEADVVIARTLASAFSRLDQASFPTGHEGPLRTRIDGTATFAVSCGQATGEIANVSVAIVDGTISPVIWGTAHSCPFWQANGARTVYDGGFTMYRYPGADLFVAIAGTMGGGAAPAQVDFRLVGRRLETRFATESGDVIVTRDGADVVVRAANGTFRCDAQQRACL
jgi:hypothetical protein